MAHADANLIRRQTIMGPTANQVITIWDLVTADADTAVEASNYLNASAGRLAKNDVIEAHLATGGTPVLKRYVVTSASGAATVTIALQKAAAAS